MKGSEAMLILDYKDWEVPTLFEELFPKALFEFTDELKTMDQLLQNTVFEEPIIEKFNTQMGRPTVPVRVYIRMMVLKFYLRVSYEDLEVIVTKTPMYKRFCRIPMEQTAPSPTALMKITTKYGDDIIEKLNNGLVQSLLEQKVIKGRRLRVDTTVVEANIEYPTDADLLYKGVEKLDSVVKEARQRCGENVRRSAKKKTKEMKQKLLSITKVIKRRTNETLTEVRKITGEMAEIAKSTLKDTLKYAEKLRPETPGDQSIVNEILHVSQLLEKVIDQTESVNNGQTPSNRIISLIDPDARPITKGKRGKRTEFGYKLQIEEIGEGIISGYKVFKGNPSDKLLIEDAVVRHEVQFGKVPREVAADRGYYSSKNEESLKSMGVKHISIPKPGRKSKKRTEFEQSNKFKKLQRFRAGVEGRISCGKRRFCLRRSMLRGHDGTSSWCGLGIFAHNLRRASQLMNA